MFRHAIYYGQLLGHYCSTRLALGTVSAPQPQSSLAPDACMLLCPHRVDGRGWAHGDWPKFPQIRMVVVQNSLDMTVFDSDAALLQGQAALKGNAGSGSVVAGYKRTISPQDALEVNAVLGLRSLLTVTSTRQLGTYTSGALSATYSYGQGLGMQVSSNRCRGLTVSNVGHTRLGASAVNQPHAAVGVSKCAGNHTALLQRWLTVASIISVHHAFRVSHCAIHQPCMQLPHRDCTDAFLSSAVCTL